MDSLKSCHDLRIASGVTVNALSFDPGLVQLRTAVTTMAGVVASFLTAWAIEGPASLQTDVVVLAVVLAVTAGRAQRRPDRRGRLLAFVVLPLAVGGSGEVSTLMLSHAAIGDAVFAAALAAAIWIRRFGARWVQLGAQVTLPLVVLLIVPAPPSAGLAHALWSALIAVCTVSWVTLSRAVAEACGFLPAGTAASRPATADASRPRSPAGPSRSRWAPNTRLAVQMAAGVGGAFAVGHWLWPAHWSWVVLTAYVVASGNRSRSDVLRKSGLRVLGAACGTVAASVLTAAFPTGDWWTVVVIFAVLLAASWLRSVSYAYWAAAVTADLALLYGYFGQHGAGLLVDRLEGILAGAVIAVAAAWTLLPIRVGARPRRGVAVEGDDAHPAATAQQPVRAASAAGAGTLEGAAHEDGLDAVGAEGGDVAGDELVEVLQVVQPDSQVQVGRAGRR
jgi:hypothetical protein